MSNTTHKLQKFCAESYFETQTQPPSLLADIEGVHKFIQRQRQANRSVVLLTVRVIITGARVMHTELEPEQRDHRTARAQCLRNLRFLDNFSAGTRGATSAEYFLKAGHAVIFMNRQFNLQPFGRRSSHSTNPFLNFLEIDAASPSSSTIDSAFPYSNDPPPMTRTP
ncbi:uncharacterized protein HD556DRAFT_1450784 [Suillus plorans]|uniref:Uncharacterized protein n=1 Tax=Suillus plorans TaxID=116603 RepID=A0A9P7DAU4_9AGAM|nr:uncharacterized protein HD556DRAFT_1450784 [Suillus plorans]KAG1785372.1 hypothetical protein HD556DRAFT_1450784 [Suillus plorans]